MAQTLCLCLSSVEVLKILIILVFTFTQWIRHVSEHKQQEGKMSNMDNMRQNHTKRERFQEGAFIFYCAMSGACCLLFFNYSLNLDVPCCLKIIIRIIIYTDKHSIQKQCLISVFHFFLLLFSLIHITVCYGVTCQLYQCWAYSVHFMTYLMCRLPI